jgi:hypothetical protein
MKKIFFLLFSVISLQISAVQAQQKAVYGIEAKANYGFLMAHRRSMQHLIKGHVSGFELNLEKYPDGTKDWHKQFGYPTVGLSFYHADVGNLAQLGTASGVYPYINFPFGMGRKFRYNIAFGWGLGYMSNKFDLYENVKNIAIGSHINLIVGFRGECEWQLSKRLYYSAGLSFIHLSNAAFRIPNLGVNMPVVSSGFSYFFNNVENYSSEKLKLEHTNHKKTLVFFNVGIREVLPLDYTKYTAFNFMVERAIVASPKTRAAGTIDLFWNNSLLPRYREINGQNENPFLLQSGVSLSYQAIIGNFSLLFYKGIYLLDETKLDGLFYHRVGCRYKIKEHLVANMTLRSHFAKADHLEFGIGYEF